MATNKLKVMLSFMREINDGNIQLLQIMRLQIGSCGKLSMPAKMKDL